MSRLKELRLHGFKSFADPTRFVFEPGVNAVLGPNGSGKSNMADAVRWVLGEQSNRSLRTRRADDVIFAGSERRRPQGMAEAVLTLDNQDGWLPIDFSEVSIGRRAYRSGESEYLLNGTRARLRDVVDLLGEGRLGANELVVVGQGTVDAALSLRADERRQLFEEAAGVKGLQVKRNEASGRLARARDNLTRVTDLVAELKPQVRRLALQAEHQQQHDALGSRARALVTASHRRREQAARSALGEARRAAAAAEAALAAFRESREADRRAVAAAEARYWDAEESAREAAAAREATREALIRAEGRVEALDGRVREIDASMQRESAELAEAQRAMAALNDGAAHETVSSALAEAAAAEEAWRDALGRLAAADDALLAAEEAVAEVRSRESDRLAHAAHAAEETARRRSRLEAATQERARAAEQLEAARATATGTRIAHEAADAERAAAIEAVERAEAERDQRQEAADATRHRVLDLTERLRAGRAELEAIIGLQDGAGRLGRRLAAAGWPSLLDRLDAPEAAWAAIEAVVGGELEGALLWFDADPSDELAGARGAARLLADGSAAEVDERGPREEAMRAVSADATLDQWAGISEAPRALRQTVVAPDVASLLRGWRRLPAGWSAVTAEGDLADARGVVVLRGRAEPPGGAAARAHARRRELSQTVSGLEREAAVAQQTAHEETERLRDARARHLAAAQAVTDAERRLRRAHDEREAAEALVDRSEAHMRQLAGELAALDAAGPAPGEVIPSPAADELARLQAVAEAARSRRDELARHRDEARERWTATRGAAEAAETRTADHRRDRAAAEARIAHLRASLPSLAATTESLRRERESLAAVLAEVRAEDDAALGRHRAADEMRAALRAELRELERDEDSTGGRLAELERAAQATAIGASLQDEALVALARERDLALEGLPPAADEVAGAEIEALDDAALDADLRRVRRTLSQIGSVNPFAVEEHRELATRLDEMVGQETDLRSAIGSTEELIGRLDAEIRGQFDSAFSAIAASFDEYCRLLFAGGSGSLNLSDDDDAEAPGAIEIVVRPPGKRLQRLAMLSGGERALTGVALLFAMLTVNPVPFCILDEVDAALDEANIGRFAQALRRLSEAIDFVVITHNRATIEVADTIYGVTMTDAAVSRVLSLRLADLPVEVSA